MLATRFLALTIAALPIASAWAQWSVSASAGVQQTELEEYDYSGSELVREHGALPGLGIRAERTYHDWRFGIDASTYRTGIRYDGRLQNGNPYSTGTDATQDRLGVDATWNLTETSALIGGVEWEHRGRHIRGDASVAGLDERSTSWRLLAGGQARIGQFAGVTLDARGLLVLARPEHLDVHFDSHVYDDATFSTKPAVGMRASLTASPVSMPRLSFQLGVDWMRVRRSDDSALEHNGTFAGTVAQPEHRRRTLSLAVGWRVD